MRVFVTGATGFIGTAVVRELIDAGHQVTGLARSDAAAKSLAAAGAGVHRGSLSEFESLRSGAAAADGVIHIAFTIDFLNYGRAAEEDRLAIETLGGALVGSDRPFIVTSAIGPAQRQGSLTTEEDAANPNSPRKSEEAALALEARGVRTSVLRLAPSVHDNGDHGFVQRLIGIAREKGVSAFIGDGLQRWSAVHRLDAAQLYRLALEKGSVAARYHGVADQGVPTGEIAEVIGRHLNLPVISKSREEAAAHFGWIAMFFGRDSAASSALTQARVGWRPVQPGLIANLKAGNYF
jgi:nucleoside-diphosphate-sugar epimerase